jgi:hypothetical protein
LGNSAVHDRPRSAFTLAADQVVETVEDLPDHR